ncbi:MAG: hypothetical protein ACQESG_06885 [Nanobdellota archaeon]
MKRWLFLLLLLTGCLEVSYDPYYDREPDYVLRAAGVDRTDYVQGLEGQEFSGDAWGRADRYLILARLTNESGYYLRFCEALMAFDAATDEERAVKYESLASVNCGNRRTHYLREAIKLWEKQGVAWRAQLLQGIMGDNVSVTVDGTELEPALNLSGKSSITIGSTSITVEPGDRVFTQVDRVYRDWLGQQMDQSPFDGELLYTFSERLTYPAEELMAEVGWHEGGRMRDLKRLGIEPHTAVGTIVVEHEGKWYAPDDTGVFRFEVPLDKVSYPTARFLADGIGLLVDTHGVNMLVEQSIRHDADVVLSDCDHTGKTKAAIYLSDHNISVICFPDRFTYAALGHDARLVGSPVWRVEDGSMVYGDAPVVLHRNETIVVTDADIGKTYAIWYYTTPLLYFEQITKTFPLDVTVATIDDFGQLGTVFDTAREQNASVVATRVFNSDDYIDAAQWLDEDESNTIILFHSTMYPYGIKLMQEYEGRISFDDPNVR